MTVNFNNAFNVNSYGPERFARERARAKANEMQLREFENERIAKMNELIDATIESTTMSQDEIDETVAQLRGSINSILSMRAERERIAMEREIERRQREADERAREQKKVEKAPQTKDEAKNAYLNETVKSVISLSVSSESISMLNKGKAKLEAEAAHMRRAIENDPKNSGYERPNDFRVRHLTNLSEGIARTEKATFKEIGKLNREVAEANKRLTKLSHNKINEDEEEADT